MIKFASLPELVWCGLVALTTGAITIWSAYLFGVHITVPGSGLLLGLGLNGFAVLVIGMTLAMGVVAAPAAVRRRWAAKEPLAAFLIALAWLTACALSAILVIRMNPLGLPSWPSDGAGEARHVIGVASVFILFMIASVVPAALLSPPARHSRHRNDQVVQHLAQPSPTTRGSERLWIVLEDLFRRSPGSADEKTVVLADGSIITSQGALADMLDTSKGSISRWLSELERAGRIEIETDARETRIRKIPLGPTAAAQFNHGDCPPRADS